MQIVKLNEPTTQNNTFCITCLVLFTRKLGLRAATEA